MSSNPNLTLTPPSTLQTTTHQIPSHLSIPNTSITNHPLLIYHSPFTFPRSLSASETASAIETHLTKTAVVKPQWRYTMYPTSHYHSTTHEVLDVYAGSARLCFGGEDNPGRVEVDVKKGDVMVVPAGVAHRLVEEGADGFRMVGSYPVGNGEEWDLCYGNESVPSIERQRKSIEALPWFTRDPVYGDEGPLSR